MKSDLRPPAAQSKAPQSRAAFALLKPEVQERITGIHNPLRKALIIRWIFVPYRVKNENEPTNHSLCINKRPKVNLMQLNQTGLLGAVSKNRQVIHNLGQTSKNTLLIYCYFLSAPVLHNMMGSILYSNWDWLLKHPTMTFQAISGMPPRAQDQTVKEK